jgi:YgiT-type zinc finger domain-containing protein
MKKLDKCYDCGGKMVIKSAPYKLKGILVGNFPAMVCTKCKAVFYDEEMSDRITKATKERGLWGIEATTKIGNIGDSLGVIINKKLADFMGLKKGELVKVYPEGRNKIIIEI